MHYFTCGSYVTTPEVASYIHRAHEAVISFNEHSHLFNSAFLFISIFYFYHNFGLCMFVAQRLTIKILFQLA